MKNEIRISEKDIQRLISESLMRRLNESFVGENEFGQSGGDEVFVLYQGDAWLTNSSLEVIGVFSSEEQLKYGIYEFVRKKYRYMDEDALRDAQEEIYQEFKNNGMQTQGHNVNLMCEKRRLDVLDIL